MTTDVAENPNPLPPPQHPPRGVVAYSTAPGEPLQTNRGPVQAPAPAPAPQPAAVQRPFTIVRDDAPAGWLKAMIYGGYGAGKTFFAGTANTVDALRDVLYLDVEGGSRTLVGMGIDRIPCQNFQTLNWVKEWLIRHAQIRDAGNLETLAKWEAQVTGQIPATPKQYRTVIIDSLSELAKLLLLELSGIKVGTSNLDAQIDNPSGEDWGQLSSRIGLMIRTFRDLPFHVLFVASAVEKEDELKRRFFQPNFSGKMAKDVQGFLDCVGFLAVQHNEAGQSQRVLSLAPGRNFDAKHRFTGTTQTQIVNPSMGDLFALHTGGK